MTFFFNPSFYMDFAYILIFAYFSQLLTTIRHYTPLFATIDHYSPLLTTIRHYTGAYAPLFELRWSKITSHELVST